MTALSKVLLCDAQDLLALLRSTKKYSTKRHRESKDVGCKCLRLYANFSSLSKERPHFNVFKTRLALEPESLGLAPPVVQAER